MAETAQLVAVTIPTFRRRGQLETLLDEVTRQAHGLSLPQVRVIVIVIDNDPECSAREITEKFGVGYESEPSRGLSAVRNRALDAATAAGADALIFVDDDEVPQAGWLEALIRPWRAGAGDFVSGSVESTFEQAADPWIIAGGFFRRVRFAEGERMAAAPSNNLLLDLETVARTDLRFDERFAATGGEDIFFTRQAVARGARIVAAPHAKVLDPVAAERLTRGWVLRRAYRVGTTTALTDVLLTNSGRSRLQRRARWGTQGLARALAGSARGAWGLLTRSTTHRARGARLAARGAGMVAGAVGAAYREYEKRDRT